MKILLIFILPILFSGCIYFNDRGISSEYYNGCREYYDSMGVYHKECDKNIIDYKEIKKDTKKLYDRAKKAVTF